MKNSIFFLFILLFFTFLHYTRCGNSIVEWIKTKNGFHTLTPVEHQIEMYRHASTASSTYIPFKHYWNKLWAKEHFQELNKHYKHLVNEAFNQPLNKDFKFENYKSNHDHFNLQSNERENPKEDQHELTIEKQH